MSVISYFLIHIWTFLQTVLSILIDKIFSLFYNKKVTIPSVTNDFLLDSAVALAEKIRNRELSSEVVVNAFIGRIKDINSIINSLVDERFEIAIEEAKAVDRFIASQELSPEDLKKKKPFFGVPFTTKESTSCAGLSYSLGLVSRQGVKGTEDADVVKLMKGAGGILLGVTNIPELNLWCETRNCVYGQTLNPYNTTRTVGGSSGGESSLITICGSPLGIGTDIGGSIRMPAFYCGIFGHKPTTGLTSMKGTTKRTGLEKNTMVVAGPMTKHSEDLIPFLKVLVGDKVTSLALDEKVDLKQVQFFYMEQSSDLRSNKVCFELTKALRRAVSHCQDVSGNQAKKLNLDGVKYSYRLWRYWMTKEPFDFPLELGNGQKRVSLLPEIMKKFFNNSEHTAAALMKLLDSFMPQEKEAWAQVETEKLRHELLDSLGDNGVLLYPSHSFPAPYHYSSFTRPFNFGYWAIFNVLNLPVTQVPLGLSSEGLPLGIQVVAAPFKDHLCLAVAAELEKAFGGWVPPFVV